MDETLLRHPGHAVVSDSTPDGFLTIGDWGCGISIDVDCRSETGRVYLVGYWDELWGADGEGSEDVPLLSIQLVARSLEDWFERWIDGTYLDFLQHESTLRREQVDLTGIADTAEVAAVWKGLYWFDERFALSAPPDPEEEEDGGG